MGKWTHNDRRTHCTKLSFSTDFDNGPLFLDLHNCNISGSEFMIK